jgi:hypothetical protein
MSDITLSHRQPAGLGHGFRRPDLQSVTREMGRTLGFAILGAATLTLAWAFSRTTGIATGQLAGVFLAIQAFTMVALALNDQRPVFLVAAGLNLVTMSAGLYAVNAGGLDILPLYGAHLLLVGIALLDPRAYQSTDTHIWGGSELAALALMILHA